jgi:capsular exopolysaccharide synthesis family protein
VFERYTRETAHREVPATREVPANVDGNSRFAHGDGIADKNVKSRRDSNVVTVPAAPAPQAPRVRSLTAASSASVSLDSKLLAKGEIRPAQVDEYRRLSTALQEMQDRSQWSGPSAVERGLKTLLVTSALPGEGKTLTVLNLATALSNFHGRRVLVIDADLHSPSIHQMLGLPNVSGLADVLSSRVREVPLIQFSPLMSVLSAGRCDPAQMAELTSSRMRTLLDECSSQFDWVLIDAPAMKVVPDPHQLARTVRAVLLVIASGSTSIAVVDKAVSEIGRSSIIGTVLNRGDHSV